jgi:Lon protease-like protein
VPPEPAVIEVALFPIPDVVAFPGMVVPLHVFEPRYRRLVHDCVNDNRLVAVSHTVKVIHQPDMARTTEEALSSNQATYKPHNVFSAGRCSIVDTTPDGRVLVTVEMSHRLTPVAELQSLPYRIVSCAPVEDADGSPPSEENRLLQKAIHNRLTELVASEAANPAKELKDPAWTVLDPAEYSFRIFQVLRFEADVMQSILETQSVTERLQMIAGFLGTR